MLNDLDKFDRLDIWHSTIIKIFLEISGIIGDSSVPDIGQTGSNRVFRRPSRAIQLLSGINQRKLPSNPI
jgi:hypothetical protein